MGEARQRRQAARELTLKIDSTDFARVAGAVHRLTQAASENLGADCVLQAALAQSILTKLDVPAALHVGYAAWRVGDGDGDVISHFPVPGLQVPSSKHLAFHAWLRIGDTIFDVTTNQLPLKAKQLDAMDGGQTTVQWAPPYLLSPLAKISTYDDVRQGQAGLYHYVRDERLERVALADLRIDSESEAMVWVLYQNPDINVLGVNDF